MIKSGLVAVASALALLTASAAFAESANKLAVFPKTGDTLQFSIDGTGRIQAGALTLNGKTGSGRIWREICKVVDGRKICVWKLVSDGGINPVLMVPGATVLLDKGVEFRGVPGTEGFEVRMYESPEKLTEFATKLRIENFTLESEVE